MFACSALLLSALAWGDATTTEKPVHVVVVAVASDQLSLDVTTASSPDCDVNALCKVMHLTVSDNVVKDQLKQLHKGDHIQIVYSTEKGTPAETKNPADAKNPTDTKNPADTKKNADTNKTGTKSPADTKKPADVKIQLVLKAWCVDSLPPGPLAREWATLGSTIACFLLYWVFSGFHPTKLIISEDNRYSNSRFQMALWFFVLITTYIAALWLRIWVAGWAFIGGVNIPQNILLLSGMSAFTFAGAKAITGSKTAVPGAAGQKASSGEAPNFFRDLTHNDGIVAVPGQPAVAAQSAVPGQPAVVATPAVPAQYTVPPQFDFGDFQMLIVTLIAVATYIVLVFNFFGTVEYSKIVSLPDVDTTLLATFGLGQGAYLTKKAVGNVGTA